MLSTFYEDEMVEKERRAKKADGGREIVKKPKMVRTIILTWEELTYSEYFMLQIKEVVEAIIFPPVTGVSQCLGVVQYQIEHKNSITAVPDFCGTISAKEPLLQS